ncbi:hypothetical protein SH601_11595 [Gracilibacillus sp. S3-1-1]|uniref:Uncharacterized protein n=1 Tax=Gracilibacillus pellucidus TaxID=3095368 RepID=A0ACC6M6S5_9BACI|nr:hypothetical protein [Gracilibacillus sp. S3-1-1]MDX8046625.1 hypothetical protein [Gracilibacillus sp. S3-1-1]
MGRSKKTKFIASKININSNIFSLNKENLVKLIPDAILGKPTLEKNTWTWKITETKTISGYGVEFIYGNLVKSRYESVNVVDGDKINNYKIPKPVAYFSRFIYDPVSEVLIFEETGQIDRDEFMERFQDLIFKSKIEIGEVIIKVIPKKEEIYNRITNMDVLTKIEFDLIPPNMHSKDTFASLDDIIHEENATRMKATFENKDGLNKDGVFIKSGVEKVSNAYGDVKAYGYNNIPSRSKRHKTKRSHTKFNSRDLVHMRTFQDENDSDKFFGKLKKFAIEMRDIIL